MATCDVDLCVIDVAEWIELTRSGFDHTAAGTIHVTDVGNLRFVVVVIVNRSRILCRVFAEVDLITNGTA